MCDPTQSPPPGLPFAPIRNLANDPGALPRYMQHKAGRTVRHPPEAISRACHFNRGGCASISAYLDGSAGATSSRVVEGTVPCEAFPLNLKRIPALRWGGAPPTGRSFPSRNCLCNPVDDQYPGWFWGRVLQTEKRREAARHQVQPISPVYIERQWRTRFLLFGNQGR